MQQSSLRLLLLLLLLRFNSSVQESAFVLSLFRVARWAAAVAKGGYDRLFFLTLLWAMKIVDKNGVKVRFFSGFFFFGWVIFKIELIHCWAIIRGWMVYIGLAGSGKAQRRSHVDTPVPVRSLKLSNVGAG